MSEALQYAELITVEEYLDGEPQARVRHEYVDGRVFAMAGASANHGLVSGNLFAALHAHTRGGPCQVFSSDMKVHIKKDLGERFYYPDVVVSCEQNETHDYYRDNPKLLIEVLSDSTWREDRHEKLPAYQAIDSLEEIVLIAPGWVEIHVFRRSEDWKRETLKTLDTTLRLTSVDLEIPVSEVYERVTFQDIKTPWYLLED